VVREQQTLEIALALTERSAPDRPLLMRRLAEGYVELESAAARARSKVVVAAAGRLAIWYYELLRSQHPEGEIVYYLAYEHELLNDLDEARERYAELIQRWPRSKYATSARRALGAVLVGSGRFREGIEVYRTLLAGDPGPDACIYQGHIAEATRALGDKDATMAELERLLDVHRRVQKEAHPAETKRACANITAAILSETAMDWHLRATGSGHESNRQKTMRLASRLYEEILERFTGAELASFQFPQIPRGEAPSHFQVQYALADLLFFQKDWSKCGPAFDAVVANAPNQRAVEDGTLSAALCYLHEHEGTRPRRSADERRKTRKRADLPPRELTGREQAMVDAWDRFRCSSRPGSDDVEDLNLRVRMKYARGLIYFDARRWEVAALDLRDAALNGAATTVGALAAGLYLEALSILGSARTGARRLR
jgi:tetratricopeptide (TPR) repeat protein